MAQLYFKYGAMGSSKTANALMARFNYEERGQATLLVKPRLDTRDGDHMVSSRIGLTHPCIYFDEMQQMTDEQLVHYVEDRVAKADSEGFNRGKASARKGTGVKEFIDYIKSAKIPGVGAVTISKLIKVADENGYI